MKKEAVFYSEGMKITADLYYPENYKQGKKYPGIILCHGFAGIKEVLIPPYAETFARHGFISLTFDYRGFGDSEGERGRLVPAEQIRDVRNAITFMTTLEDIDETRLGLWGTSFGGANAIFATSLDDRIQCLVVQLTFANGERVITGSMTEEEQDKLKGTLNKVWQRTVIQNRSMMLAPNQILTDEQSKKFFGELIEKNPKLNVKIPLLTIQHTMEYRPEDVIALINIPVLIIAADKDIVNPLEESNILYSRANFPKELMILEDASHYECYSGEHFSQTSKKALQWFSKHMAK